MQFNFEKLEVYNKAKIFTNKIYLITKKFPKDEIFGLTNQVRRSSVSILLNIAEGSARSKKEFSRFLDMARGSIFESMAILQISLEQNYVSDSDFQNLKSDLIEISKMISGLKRSLFV